ncbi:MAG: hypothetical protein INR81_09675 [Microcystis aeruginosa PMC 728.11]|jgi:hypothetical protein|nr:hypothetical protein [Microcystis aeruginosa PMC 728.11]
MSKNSKEHQLLAIINQCISDYQDYPYVFWLNQIGKSPLIVKYLDKKCHTYEIEIDSVFDDKTSKVIRVMFTIWGGYLDNCGTTGSILIAPN